MAAGVRMTFVADSCYSRGLLEASPIRTLVRGVLPDPIDVKRFAVDRGGSHRPFRIGFMGSKSPNKGLHRLVAIAELLRDEAVEWHVYGIDVNRHRTPYVGRCLAEIERLGLASTITLHGQVEDTTAAYAGMDALLLASDRENIPRVCLEAMASGIPVVATRVGSVPEAVWDGVAGLLFDRGDVAQAALLLRRIVVDTDLWGRLSAGARQAATRFDVSAVGRLLDDFYADIIEDGARRRSPTRHNATKALTGSLLGV
jgi:glycosyltransferase involved in cell wall biosynthesis